MTTQQRGSSDNEGPARKGPSGLTAPPSFLIEVPLEGDLVVRLIAEHEEEHDRLLDWINDGRPEYADLVLRALALERAAKAA